MYHKISLLTMMVAGILSIHADNTLPKYVMQPDSKIFVAGHNGLVGSALIRRLNELGFKNIITRTSKELDLRNQAQTDQFFKIEKPEFVFLAAAKVGGIKANYTYPAEFIYNNLMIEANVIHASYQHGVKKLLLLGSSCIYPRDCPQPMREEYLLTGPLEITNEAYAVAKIAGLKLVEYYNKQFGTNYISCMPTNLYGPGDNFNLETSHVLPALIRKFCAATDTKEPSVPLWGSGSARREFLYIDDLADACVFLMQNYVGDTHVNVGTGSDITIDGVARIIKQESGFTGEIKYDRTTADGTPQKLLDVTMLKNLGWTAKTSLEEGIKKTIAWYKEHVSTRETTCQTH